MSFEDKNLESVFEQFRQNRHLDIKRSMDIDLKDGGGYYAIFTQKRHPEFKLSFYQINDSVKFGVDKFLCPKDPPLKLTNGVLLTDNKELAINIPNEAFSIGDKAFFNSGITSVSIPSSVQYISLKETFTNNPDLKEFNVDENNPHYSSLDGVLFDKKQTSIIKFPDAKSTEYKIPDTVTIVEENAFNGCKNLKNIEFSNNTKLIGNGAFCNCSGLRSVEIPEGVVEIGECAFMGCKNLNSITIPASVERICLYAFSSCHDLTINFEGTQEQWNLLVSSQDPHDLVDVEVNCFGTKSIVSPLTDLESAEQFESICSFDAGINSDAYYCSLDDDEGTDARSDISNNLTMENSNDDHCSSFPDDSFPGDDFR